MRLTELDPQWYGCGGENIFNADGTPTVHREHIGMSFLCPCQKCVPQRKGSFDEDYQLRHYAAFANPPDGGPAFKSSENSPTWTREGETWDTLRLSPSILSDPAKGGCGWHGYIGQQVPGEVTTC